MATHSTVTAVKTALVTQLQAQSSLAAVQVVYSHPGSTMQAQCIYLGKVEGPLHVPVMRGRTVRVVREEEYVIDVIIDVADGSKDSSTSEATAYGIYAALEDVLSTDPTLGGLDGLVWALPHHQQCHPYFDDSRRGFGCQLKIEVAVKARLN